jgi:hypothetical protein
MTLFHNLEEKAVVAMSVLPALLDKRGKNQDYNLVHIIEVRSVEHSIYCILT